MDSSTLINANPTVYERRELVRPGRRKKNKSNEHDGDVDNDAAVDEVRMVDGDVDVDAANADESARDEIDEYEVFDMLRDINDPEHPLTLEQLAVVQLPLIAVSDADATVAVSFTPTIPHCSMASLIGLCVRVKLLRSLPARFKVDVRVTPGSHSSESAVNKQLADKERVAAALENEQLLGVINGCLRPRVASSSSSSASAAAAAAATATATATATSR